MQAFRRQRRSALQSLTDTLETMAQRVRQVVKQTKARIFQGLTRYPGKIVSLFEPHTEIIRKGKASKPTEFGKLVKVQEAENQIITHYEVFAERPVIKRYWCRRWKSTVADSDAHQKWWQAMPGSTVSRMNRP